MSKKRFSYSAEFKLKVISKAEDVGNREAGRIFQVPESNVRLWRQNKEKFATTSNKKRRSFRSGHASWPTLEDDLYRWVVLQRENKLPLSTVKIRLKAQTMAEEMGLKNFKGGPTWVYRFMNRKNLCVRNRTTVGQRLPEDWSEKCEDFLQFTRKLVKEKKITNSEIYNMDEVPMCFDCPPNRTVETVGSKTVSIATTGHEKSAFTVVLACSANGEKLPPMIIFKRKTIPKETFPKGLEIRANEKGWMTNELMISWLKNVWQKRKNSLFKPRALLIMDSMKAHTHDSVKLLSKEAGASLAIIPGGLTKKLQPLDSGINRSFKGKVREKWEKWMSEEEHSYTKTGRMRRASYADVCTWIKEAWDYVSTSTIKNSFRKCDLYFEFSASDIDMETESDDTNSIPDISDSIRELFNSDTDESDFDGFM